MKAKLFSFRSFVSYVLVVCTMAVPVHVMAGDYLQNPSLLKLIDTLVQEQQFERLQLLELFSEVKRNDVILDAMSKPAEKTKNWGQYRPIFINEVQIKAGLEFWQNNEREIARAANQYGVDPAVIVAIIGVETRYGRFKGRHRVIDALSTLAFDFPRRSKFFYKELREFLLLTREAGLDAAQVKGSYAGAMGYPQFIPSSYRHYAVDFDEDGQVNLLESVSDAIGSVANYFSRHGWKKDVPVVLPINLAQAPVKLKANRSLKPKHTIAQLNAQGLALDLKKIPVSKQTPATLIKLVQADKAEYWLGLHNFYVITRYNSSRLYAMAVHELSQTLQARKDN